MPKKLTSKDIATMIRLGDISGLQGAMCQDPIIGHKVDEVRELFESYKEEMTALHILLGFEE